MSQVTRQDIEAAVASAGLPPLPEGAASKFEQYLSLLLKWNARLNLTAVREPAEIVQRHFLECIQCALALPSISTLLDFGSGAGLPGIPIALLRPEIKVILGESQAKKAAFLREAARTLDLQASIFDGRIEAMPASQRFEAITLRAVDKMAEACAIAIHHLDPSGWLMAFASESTDPLIRKAAHGLSWSDPIPLFGRDKSYLLLGRKLA